MRAPGPWLPVAIWLPVVLLASCKLGDNGDKRAKEAVWYDAAKLYTGLRPQVAGDANRRLGLRDPSDLTYYALDLKFGSDLKSFEFTETAWFTHTGTEPLPDLVFRVFANARKDAGESPPIVFRSGQCPEATCSVSSTADGVISVTPSKPLAPRDRIKVVLRFTGTLDTIETSRTGLLAQALEGAGRMFGGHDTGKGDYGIVAFGNDIASLGDFYAVLAPRVNGQWVREEGSTMGDLSAAARVSHVSVDVTGPAGVQIASSGVIASQETTVGPDGAPQHTVTRIVAPFVRNFALLASRKFEMVSHQAGPVLIRSWCITEHAKTGKQVLDAARHSFEVFEEKFGSYPYVELDVVEAPLVGGAGGVEFSGLVTIASMFYQPVGGGLLGMIGTTMRGAVQPMVEFVTAHEVAHQWWHGVVGSDARGAPFVDEALAQHSAVLYFEKRHGEERASREQARQVVANYHFMRMQGKEDQPVDQSVDAFGDEVVYAGIIYGKAPMMYPAIRAKMGDDRYFRALQSYVRKHRLGMAEKDALTAEFVAQAPAEAKELRALTKRWLTGRHGDDDLGEPKPAQFFKQWAPQDADKQLEGQLEGLLKGFGLSLEGLKDLGKQP